MRELIIGPNEENQRLDRFVAKYLDLAPKGFINKMIRKKNIELNRKKSDNSHILKAGDKVQLFLSEDTINKFQTVKTITKSKLNLDIIYEDENLIIINKPQGILSHSSGLKDEGENIVDALINYMMEKGLYNPDEELTFIPSISNRLDKNTSGIILAGKNAEAVRQINQAMNNRQIKRLYKTIVYGNVKSDAILKGNLQKDHKDNKVYIVDDTHDSKEIETHLRVLKSNRDYSLLEVELITGRTHQIRAHLNYINHPILGDRKYKLDRNNDNLVDKYNINYQLLHAYKVILNGFEKELSYLNNKEFTSNKNDLLNKLETIIFGG